MKHTFAIFRPTRRSALPIRPTRRSALPGGIASSFFLIAFALTSFGGELSLSFEGTAECPLKILKARNLEFRDDGVFGKCLHMPTNGWLEYELPAEFLKKDEGTFRYWIRFDRTIMGVSGRIDHYMSPAGKWETRCANPDFRNVIDFGNETLVSDGPYLRANLRGVGFITGHNGYVHAGEWHQFGISWKRDRFFCIYMDGQCVYGRNIWAGGGKAYLAKGPLSGKTLRIGCGPAWGGMMTPSLEACLDEIVVSDRALSAADFAREFAQAFPDRCELLDFALVAGETGALRFRSRTYATQELKEFTRTYRFDKPGPATVTLNDGTRNYRAFDVMVLDPASTGEERGGDAASTGTGKGRTLVEEYDCTREYPTNVFFDCGSHLVTNADGLVYRELDANGCNIGFGYRFHVKHPKKPHWLVLTYPNDAKREYIFGAFTDRFNHIYQTSIDGAGVMTGGDVPFRAKPEEHAVLYWPDNETSLALVLGYEKYPLSRPPAAVRVALYEADDFIAEVAKVPPRTHAPGPDERTLGTWDEDPVFDATVSFCNLANWTATDLSFWRTRWERVIDYMKYHGYNEWNFKFGNYWGDVTGMKATLGHPNPSEGIDGRCLGWDTLGAAMLSRAGMGFWSSMILSTTDDVLGSRNYSWFSEVSDHGRIPDLELSLQHSSGKYRMIPGHPNRGYFLKPYRPELKRAIKNLIRAQRDRYKVYPGFRGIEGTFFAGFTMLGLGYDDETVALFSKATGIAVPGATPQERYAFLTAPQMLPKWMDWRCRVTADILREYVAVLRDDGGDWKLHFTFDAIRPDQMKWPNLDINQSLRERGIDVAMLRKVPGLRLSSLIYPDQFRSLNELGLNEPYLFDSPEASAFLKEHGIRSVNSYQSKFEVWWAAAGNFWKWPFYCKWGSHDSSCPPDFRCWAMSHPPTDFAAEPYANQLAELDVDGFIHGFWGPPDTGVNVPLARFFRTAMAIPIGDFRPLGGFANDPIAVRVSTQGKGWYAVNRLPWPVTLRTAGGETVFAPCEVRYRAGACPWKGPELSCRLDAEAERYFTRALFNVRTAQKLNPSDRTLGEIKARMDAAVRIGAWARVRNLMKTGAARAAQGTNPIAKSLSWNYATDELTVTISNYGMDPWRGKVTASTRWSRGKQPRFVPADGKGVATLEVKSGESGSCVIPFAKPADVKELESSDIVGVTVESAASRTSAEYFFGSHMKDGETCELTSKGGKKGTLTLTRRPDASGVDILVEADDPVYCEPENPAKMWERDSLQIYFDQRCNSPMAYGVVRDADDLVFQIGRYRGAPRVYGELPADGETKGIVADVIRDEAKKRTTYRVFVPAERLPLVDLTKPGLRFRFGVLVNAVEPDGRGGLKSDGLSFGRHRTKWNDPFSWRPVRFDQPVRKLGLQLPSKQL